MSSISSVWYECSWLWTKLFNGKMVAVVYGYAQMGIFCVLSPLTTSLVSQMLHKAVASFFELQTEIMYFTYMLMAIDCVNSYFVTYKYVMPISHCRNGV